MPKHKSIAKTPIVSQRPSKRSMSKTDFEALAAFRYQLRLFLRFSEELCQKSDITPLQYQMLLQIKGFPGREWASVTELAERLQAKHHGVVALVSRCESLNLVRRQTSATDLRQVEVHLTPQGQHVVDRLALQHRDELQTFLDYCGHALLPPPAATPAQSGPARDG
jgi:DNA-binding MarR family transcriptional regulator